jgi:hypothetical protein
MLSKSHQERESLSAVVDINLLFWSKHAEQELINKVQQHLQQSLEVVTFDTMSNHYSYQTGDQLNIPVLLKAAQEMRDNIVQLEKRLESRITAALNSTNGSQGSADLDRCLTTVLIAPWTILPDWHEGLRIWRLEHGS